MFEIKSYIDINGREIYEIQNETNENEREVFLTLDGYPKLVPVKDFRYLALVDIPVPMGGIPVLMKIRIPIPEATTVEEAFNKYEETIENFNKIMQEKMQQQNQKPKLVLAQDVPNG